MFISPNEQILIKATSIKKKDVDINKLFANDFIYFNLQS